MTVFSRRQFGGWAALLTIVTVTAPLAADDSPWNQFRGPNGSGTVSTTSLPTEFGPKKSLLWTTPLPGPGSSSPILVDGKIFLTCWTGYGTSRDKPGDPADLRRHLVCMDQKTGKILWQSSVSSDAAELPYGGMLAEHGYASNTPVSDGEHVYSYFGKAGLVAYDLDGKELWKTIVGTGNDPRSWGSASSPVLVGDLVVVNAAAEAGAMVAVNKMTGKEVWRTEAENLNSTWATPVVVTPKDGEPELVIPVTGEVWGINPGKRQASLARPHRREPKHVGLLPRA